MITGTARIGGKGPKLLDRAEAYAISLAQCSIDSACLSDTHLGPMDERGYV
jgi:hypothetical protein